jgi:hypothetical protein
MDLPYDPAISLLWIYLMKCDSVYSRGTCTPIFITVLFIIAKLWKQPRCLTTDEWIKKMWYLYAMNKCITTRIDSSLPDLFTTSWPPSHRGLGQFKITTFAPLQ